VRVKVRRRLERLGAVAIKSSVYAIPASDDALEDLRWLMEEIQQDQGTASLARAVFVDGVTHERLVGQSRAARDGDFQALVREATALRDVALAGDASGLETKAGKILRRLDEMKRIDFFHADGRAAAERAVREAVEAISNRRRSPAKDRLPDSGDVGSGRTWVTRKGIKVDRMASAWLIRRFIDPEARFLFVSPDERDLPPDSLRFDMFEGEYTHVGDGCTFETLIDRFGLDRPSLRALAQIVHDIDCKDEKFGRAETPGVLSLVDGIVLRHPDDATRLEHGSALFESLHESLAASVDG
jgi:hypothetical protein